MEIEIPRRLIGSLLWALLIIVPLLVGWIASPAREDGRPLLLTPRLAQVNRYRQDVRNWAEAFQRADEELAILLEEPAGDLFEQNGQVNRVYQRVKQVAEDIDQSPVPPTFEPLHELLAATSQAYVQAAITTARWISEPVDGNRQAAQDALSAARCAARALEYQPLDRGETMKYREHDDFELMSMRRMSDSLDATRLMLAEALKIAKQSQACLLNMAMEFCSREMQEHQAKNEDLSRIPPEELAAMLRERFKTLKLVASDVVVQQTKENARLVGELRKQVADQHQQVERAREEVERMKRQVRSLEKTLENERQARREAQAQVPPAPNGAKPADEQSEAFQRWYAAWKLENRTWERDSKIVVHVGKSGLSLSTELEAAIAQEMQVSTRTVHRALLNCVEAELLEQETIAALEGRPPQRYTLTGKGRWLYHQLTGEEPATPERETLLKAHKSDRHLAVILKTGELFAGLGYAVDREPVRLQIDEKRYFLPDLVVSKDGETFYLEVEIGARAKPGLEQKWENALTAGGRICVVTDNLNTLRRIQGSIAQWSGYDGVSVKLYITCLAVLKEKKAGRQPLVCNQGVQFRVTGAVKTRFP